MDYRTLNAMPAEAFLTPKFFRTSFDGIRPEYAKEQFEKGKAIADISKEIGISARGTWYAIGHDDSHTTAYEGIGYHANTAELLEGFLAGKAKLVVNREIEGKLVSFEIKPAR